MLKVSSCLTFSEDKKKSSTYKGGIWFLNATILNHSFRKCLIFGSLYWLRCIDLLLQWLIIQILKTYPNSTGKTSSNKPEWMDCGDRSR